MPKVSVIIPVYNVEQYLRECLSSVVNQTLKDIEIILVDDGSTDNTADLVHEWQKKDNGFEIQYVYKQNGVNLPRTVKDLEKAGTEVPTLADVQIGDLICTPGSGKSGKHIKIVSRIEDG